MIHSCFNNCDKVSSKWQSPCKAGLVNTNYNYNSLFKAGMSYLSYPEVCIIKIQFLALKTNEI